MSEFEPEPEHIDFEDDSQDHNGISRVGATAMGLAWGLTTFESGAAFYHFVLDNHDRIGDYSLKNQLVGAGLFSIGGLLFGRFIYNNSRNTGEQ